MQVGKDGEGLRELNIGGLAKHVWNLEKLDKLAEAGRIIADGSSQQPEAGLGITAAAGAQWRLKELVGEPIALEILWAGRILNAQEALDLHLVTELHSPEELMDGAHALADRIGKNDPLAVRVSKRVFHMPRAAHPHVDELAQAILFESEAKFDRMQAFLDRKKK